MKKIRVYQLAKKKKITSKELIELLKKKGLKKLVAQSMVDPSILDQTQSESKEQAMPAPKEQPKVAAKPAPKKQAMPAPSLKSGNVAHITSAPSHWGSAAKAPVPAPAAERRKLEDNKKAEAPPKEKVKQERVQKEPEKKIAKLDIVAAVASIIALIIAGLSYTAVQSDKVALKELNSNIEQLQTSISANKTEMEKLSGKINATEKSILTSQLRSEADVIRSLSARLDEPLKIKANALADKLSSF